ncbi:uncharacterized protein AB675_5931 [Cyphellophora attinorum]|uniref:Uncharacterized protein n=1 Tax=Cyphellophora attinorum TaxID=1664694 RepID=A0A0N0NL69_9EURO|nr:uncharacterized protein AB675_5931 [Phialophora attinorum]KPI38689.1 hypothetical protein AB675_5931 [Phialophora attinorum]
MALCRPTCFLRPRQATLPSIYANAFSGRRPFANKSSLLRLSRPPDRPQLPFLYSRAIPKTGYTPTSRYITTEAKGRWKQRIKNALKIGVGFWTAVFLIEWLKVGISHTKIENEYPTPHDWSFWSRWKLRKAHWIANGYEGEGVRVYIDWGDAGKEFKDLLERLENESQDGQNILKGETLVAGVGRTGFDVSMKSIPWRRGYFQALMGAANAAEHLEDMVRKKGGNDDMLYPRESIPGPSNPRPKPMRPDRYGRRKSVPNEDEVENAFAQPEVYYMKIMTTIGFSSSQKIDAALAYAEWCDFKGLHDTARNMYDWALDIGTAALPESAGQVVNNKTGAINAGKDEFVTSNLFRVTTALGVHQAQIGNSRDALAVFLSILRARKTLPAAPQEPKVQKTIGPEKHPVWTWIEILKNYLLDKPYPRISSDGDERPFHTLKEACEEVGLMTYIGEILFASGDKEKIKGLSWTRDSVEAAEAVLWVMDEQGKKNGRERCKECLETGLKNWQDMTVQMSRLSRRRKEEAEQYQGILGTGLGRGATIKRAENEVLRWQEEEHQIDLRRQKTLPLLRVQA